MIDAEKSLEMRRAGEQRTLQGLLIAQTARINQLAGVAIADRLLQLAMLATRKSKALQNCSVESIVKAVLDAARLGLDLDGVQAALIPFAGDAVCLPMVRGLLALAYREKTVEAIESRIAYEDERFDVRYGTEAAVVHAPRFVSGPRKIVAAYAVAHIRGRALFEVMSLEEVCAIRDRSSNVQWAKKHGKTTPWDDSFGEMARKTVVKRLCKSLPTGDRLRAAITHDNNLEAGIVDSEVVTTTAKVKEKPALSPGAIDVDDEGVQRLLAEASSEMSRVGVAQEAGARDKALADAAGGAVTTTADLERAVAALKKRPTAGGQGDLIAPPKQEPRDR
jgi:recombination protein RecT